MLYPILELLDDSLAELSNREQRNLLKDLEREIYLRLEDVCEEKDEYDEDDDDEYLIQIRKIMRDAIEPKIDEIISIDGTMMICIKNRIFTSPCELCVVPGSYCANIKCTETERSDNIAVHFVYVK